MANNYFNPQLPYLDRVERVRPTVPLLIDKCEMYANSNEQFRKKERFEFKDDATWINPDTHIQWLVGFTALHSYDDIVKPVKSFEIELATTLLLKRAPKELRKHVIDSDYKLLSDDDNIEAITYSHIAKFIVDKNANLGWNVYRTYTIEFTDKVKGVESLPTTFSYLLEHYPSPALKTDGAIDLLAGAFTEVHINQASKILDMLDLEHEKGYDMSSVFPLDVYEGNCY